ncbi:hypothetical protein NGB36_27190 [Streptomyces sp. RB6PN25]|uniref:Integral membrane protein n=1 Tax=Streptomyces humicola TaxID=2953240 RepID=A0ABT1Q498_9ACTN|nr:hypothetical protein [Streptomyces humicola]MCQ4084160.1 hypothetical protein [Streptomyces humicola]
MPGLRLIRGERPAALLRRALVPAASAGTGFLLLTALGHTMARPWDTSGSVVRLVWCVVPLAAAVHLSVAVCRSRPGGHQSAGLTAAGLGPGRMTLLAAAQVAMECLLGSAVALPAFVWWWDRFAVAGVPMPVGAVLTLLLAVPLAGGAVCAVVLRPRRSDAPGATADGTPSGLPWGVALTAAGLAIEVYASDLTRPAVGSLLPLPGGLGRIAPAVLLGWLLTAAGLVLTGPGLVHLSGRLLSACRPGALRLLAGRTLQQDASRIGQPLGVLCAAASAALAALRLYAPGAHPLGPLTALGAALVLGCPAATVLTTASEAQRARREAVAVLGPLGAPASLMRRATLLRAAALLLVLAPVTSSVAWLASLPFAA